jgi:cysteine desulfurase
MTASQIYLDNQASTPVDPRVLAAMMPYFFDAPGNPHSSEHAFGWAANAAVEAARSRLARVIGADDDEIVFTSGATESNNLAILGLAARAPSNRRRILTSAIEHKSVLSAARSAAERLGCVTDLLPVDSHGVVRLDSLKEKLADDVLLVSVMGINNEVGSTQPLREISGLCRKVGALFHSDGAQALAAGQIDVGGLGLDMLSLSAHKIYGPKGIGVLYISRERRKAIEPLIYGGGQQDGLRAGTLPVLLCIGFGEAASLMTCTGADDERNRIARLRDRFVEQLAGIHPGTRLVGAVGSHRHPGNANVLFPGVDAADLIGRLQPRVAASTGAACTSGITEPSHVLVAMGLSPQEAESCIRFSFGRFSTVDDVEVAVAAIAEALSRDL